MVFRTALHGRMHSCHRSTLLDGRSAAVVRWQLCIRSAHVVCRSHRYKWSSERHFMGECTVATAQRCLMVVPLLLCAGNCAFGARTWYVDLTATNGLQNGTSWANAQLPPLNAA